ncbi:oligosaccharide repeat unit polymerase [Isobaculum melis]|uniref:Oligosaccharide repeat unit polymerase n=1 Tax=Isobaculum melis TaxID=142588 RepID=A0A1H9QPF8_9LACT|nr:oligosaccharide repeat unit polymerase [Isobaculum melis]SER62386.1 hypothetical protein SAMN04488559_102205 [Isobaculum melis]
MNKKIIFNPFSLFFIIILLTTAVYSLSWSSLAPSFSGNLWWFFGFILISLLFFSKLYNKIFPPGTFDDTNFKMSLTPWAIIATLSMLAEFAYEKAIPIINILILKDGYNYSDFEGIPTFHVFVLTFVSFVGLLFWQKFLDTKKISQLFMSIFFVSYPMMLFNRGGFIMNVITMCFLFIYYKKTVTIALKYIIGLLVIIVLFFYGFGIFGNIRSAPPEETKEDVTSSLFIMETGKATSDFKKSSIPKPFFWGYLYVATPLANFQNIVQETTPNYNMTAFFTESVLPDFVGKRIVEAKDIKIPEDELVSPVFNVSTFFSSAYKTLGYTGIFLIYFYFVGFVFFYSYLMKKMHTTTIIALSIICTITVFNLFSNMMIFSGFSFQLIYPIMFWMYKKIT